MEAPLDRGWMITRVLAIPMILAAAAAASAQAEPAREARYRALLSRGLEAGLPALVVVIDRPGEPVWSGAAGTVDLRTSEPATTTSRMHLASVNKLTTALAVLRLVDEGRLRLEDRVIDRLAGDEVVATLPHVESVTVGQLLDHSSGLYATNNDPEYIEALIGPRAGESARWTPHDFVRLSAAGDPVGEPGSGHYYSDTNYVLLGLVVEAVMGESYRDWIVKTQFEPLGMERSYFLSDFGWDAELPAGTARGYLKDSEVIRSITEISDRFPRVGDDFWATTAAGERLDAAAGIVGGAGDLHRIGRAVFRGDLLSPESRSVLLAAADGLDAAPLGTERQRTLRGHRKAYGVLLAAEGDGPGGSHSLLAYHPETGTIVVALTNVFGLWTESDFFFDDVVATALGHGG